MCVYKTFFPLKKKAVIRACKLKQTPELPTLFKKKNTLFFFLLVIFPAIWICQFTASLHVYDTAFLQQLSLSQNAVVHLVC